MPDWIGTFQNRARHDCSKLGQHCIDTTRQGFPRPFTHGGISPSYGGQVQRDKALMRGLMRGDIDLMGGPNFDRLYHKLKVLLMSSCNYTMQFFGYDSIKTR